MHQPAQLRTYKDLNLWKEAKALMADVYQLCARRPAGLDPDLASQIRRAAVSIVSNIAEGHGRGSNKDCCRFLFIAKGSLLELDAQVEVCSEIGILSSDDALRLIGRIGEVGRLLGGLIKYRRGLPDRQSVTKSNHQDRDSR